MKSSLPKMIWMTVACACWLLSQTFGQASITVKLAWDPSPAPDVAQYNVYCGEVNGSITNNVAVTTGTTATTQVELGKTYFMYVTAVSTAGAESDPSNYITYTASSALQLTAIPDQTISEQTPFVVALSASGAASGTVLSFGLVSGPSGLIVDKTTGILTWTPTEAQGPNTYTVTVQVTDNGKPSQTDSKTFTLNVTEKNNTPSLAAVSNQSIAVGAQLKVQLSGSDTDVPAQTLKYSLVSGPSGAAVDSTTGAFTWTPSSSAAGTTSSVTVQVADSGSPVASASRTFSITVPALNSAPVLTAVPNLMVAAGGKVTWQLAAQDSDLPAQTLKFALVSGPSGASVDGAGVFSWSPSLGVASTTASVTVSVTDSGSPTMSDSKSFSVIVGGANQNPVLNAISDQTVAEGSLLTFQLSATDADQPAQQLVYSLIAPPTGMTVDPTTGIVRWTPSEDQGPNTYTVTAQVMDTGAPAGSAQKTFKVTVTEVNTAPVLSSISDQQVSAGQVLMLALSATDKDLPVNKLTYQLVSGPSGASVDSKTGVFTWRLSKTASAAIYTVTVSVSDDAASPLTDTKSFRIVVSTKGRNNQSSTGVRRDNLATLSWVSKVDDSKEVRFTYPIPSTGESGSGVYYLEASTDLKNWVPIGVVSDTDEFVDVDARGAEQRFFRVRSSGTDTGSGSSQAVAAQ